MYFVQVELPNPITAVVKESISSPSPFELLGHGYQMFTTSPTFQNFFRLAPKQWRMHPATMTATSCGAFPIPLAPTDLQQSGSNQKKSVPPALPIRAVCRCCESDLHCEIAAATSLQAVH